MPTDPSRRDAIHRLLRGAAVFAAAGSAAQLTACGARSRSRVGEPIPDDPEVRIADISPRLRRSPGDLADGPFDSGVPTGVIPRTRWTSARPVESNTVPMRSPRFITIHHDASGVFSPGAESATAQRLEAIRRAHASKPGWADIGYHYAVDPSGRVWEARPLRLQGAHVADKNANNIGVVMLGHYNHQTPTPQATRALDRFLFSLMDRHRIGIDRVWTHQEWAATECPGVHLQRYMDATRSPRGGLALALSGGRFNA